MIPWIEDENVSVFGNFVQRMGEEAEPVFDSIEEVDEEDEGGQIWTLPSDVQTSKFDFF